MQIVASERIGDKVKRRIVRYVLDLSSKIIHNILVHVQQSILVHKTNGAHYGVPSKPAQHARKIYQHGLLFKARLLARTWNSLVLKRRNPETTA